MDARLQELLDHHEIRKVLAIYCHGCDRADADLMGSVYLSEGSFDDHGIVRAPGPEYARLMTRIIQDTTKAISHTLGQSIILVDGNEARAETFFLAFITADAPDGTPHLTQLAGRFIDVLTRTGETWAIRLRKVVHDLSITHKVEADFMADNQLPRGSRNADDPGVALLCLAHRLAAGDTEQTTGAAR